MGSRNAAMLHHGCFKALPSCQRTPTSSLTVGPEGLEPSPTTLREWNAAANTLVPCGRAGADAVRRERLEGIAPSLIPWQGIALLLRHSRFSGVARIRTETFAD